MRLQTGLLTLRCVGVRPVKSKAGRASHYTQPTASVLQAPLPCTLCSVCLVRARHHSRQQVRDQALAAERAGTARYRAQLGAEAAALEARLESDWQHRAAAEAARLAGQRAAAAAEAHAEKVRLPAGLTAG